MPTIPLLRILFLFICLLAPSGGSANVVLSGSGTLTLSGGWQAPNYSYISVNPYTSVSGSFSNSGGTLYLGDGDFIFGGGGILFIEQPANLPPIPRDQSRTIRFNSAYAQTFLFTPSDFATDPNADFLRIVAVEGDAGVDLSANGQRLEISTRQPGELRVTVEDSQGGRCVGTVKFTVWDSIYRDVTGYEGRIGFDLPSFGFASDELTIEITRQAFTGQAVVMSGLRIEYGGMNQRIMSDSFRFAVKHSGGMIADLTVFIRNIGEFIMGNYQVETQNGRWIGRITVQPDGAFTAVLQSATGTIRRQGNLLRDANEEPSEGTTLRLNVVENDSGDRRLGGSLHSGLGDDDLYCYPDSELGRMAVPQVNALLRNSRNNSRIIYQGGRFLEVKGKSVNLPSSYAIIRKGVGASVTLVGRHYDGSPWAGTGFVFPDGYLPFVTRGMAGSLMSHRNGNVTGAVRGELPNKGAFVTVIGGSAFTPRPNGVNVFKGQRTPVRVRSLFPLDFTLPSFVEASGRVTADGPSGLRVSATIDRTDGTVSGTVNAAAINVNRPINGLFIPHKQLVVGFTGDEIAKPFTIQRR